MELQRSSNEEIGKLLANRYRIEKVLGQGGMGKVYLATDTVLANERIALKLLREELCKDEKHTQRFIREVQLNRILNHPNVVKVFDVGTHNQSLFLTMEYVEGMTLKERLSDGPLETKEAVHILKEICHGLSAVHIANIIHRDLKPGNVILGKDGTVKIADFGVARPGISDLTAHDEVIGCAPYIAPEVWMGKSVGTLADIYALGIIAYEMMSNELPFDADSPGEMMRKHLDARPFPLQQLNGKVPRWLNSLIMRMLEKEPLDRPQGAEEIIEILEQAEDRGNKTFDSNFALDSGLLNTLQLLEDQASNTASGESDEPTPVIPPTAAVSRKVGANGSAQEVDDWLSAEPVDIEEPDFYVPLGPSRPGAHSQRSARQYQNPSMAPASALKIPNLSGVPNPDSISKIARPRKNTSTKIAAEVPLTPLTFVATLRSGVQIFLLLAISAVTLYLLQGPISSAVAMLWRGSDGQPPVVMVAFLGYIMAIMCCSALCAAPIIPLALFGSRFLSRFRAWSRAWTHTALMIAISSLALFSMNLFRFGVETADYSVLTADTIFRILESSMKALFTIITLSPTIPTAKPTPLPNVMQALEVQELTHWICVFFFLFLLGHVVQRYIYGKHSLRSDYIFLPLLFLVTPLLIIQNLVQEYLISTFTWLSHDPQAIRIGAFRFDMSSYMMAGAAINWLVVALTVCVIAPVLARRKRKFSERN